MRRLRAVSRRSFLTSVAGGAAAGSFLLVTGRSHAAQPQGGGSACSDADDGENADPGGQGRNCTPGQGQGCSDSDAGANADPGGQGRNCSPGGNGGNVCSDNDPSDPVGQGRSCRPGQRSRTTPGGCSDRDSGRNADPVGQGRTCAPQGGRNGGGNGAGNGGGGGRQQPRTGGCSDNDPVQGGDPSGNGRRCTPGHETVSLDVQALPCAASGCAGYRPPVTGSYCARPGCGYHLNRHGAQAGRSDVDV